MILETFPVGPLRCNCTVLGDETTHEAVVIDPGDNIPDILARLTKHGLTLRQIIVTHAHIDHVGGAVLLRPPMPVQKTAWWLAWLLCRPRCCTPRGIPPAVFACILRIRIF